MYNCLINVFFMHKVFVSNWRHLFLLDCNPVIRWLTVSDAFLFSSVGLLAPIFALFIDGYIVGGSTVVAGMAATIFLFTRSIAQIPAASIIDRIRGERDDFWFLVIGTFVSALIPLAYIFISTPSELYLLEFVYGLANAFTFPSWCALFTRHIDKNREGVEWGVYQTLIDLSSAGAAVFGGVIAEQFGFKWVFILVSFLGILGSLLLLSIRRHIRVR